MGLVEMTSLLEKEVITPKVGREHCYVIDLWRVIFQFENGPGLAVPFQFKMVRDF
jgi:hypothetical protein